MSFEQGATSLVLVARDNIDRSLTGAALTTFNVVNGLLTIVPLSIISWVLIKWEK
jgi:POT family proton-dependent oligopeptide transporter